MKLHGRTRFANAIKDNLFTSLKELSLESRIPISKLLDEAVELLLAKHSK